MIFPREKISTVANFINGFAFKPVDWGKTGYPIIRIQNLTNSSKPFNRTERNVPEKYLVRKGDILVSWSATIDVFEWELEDSLLNQHIFKVEFDKEKIDKLYFKLALKKTIRELSRFSHGSTMKHIVKKDFENHKISLPESINDQIRIATLLTRIEALIATREENLLLLDDFLKSTFLEMFGDPVMNHMEWKTKPLSKIGRFKSGATPSKKRNDFWEGSFPWVSPKDMKVLYISNSLDHISEKVFEETTQKKIMPDHLLMVVRGMILAHSFPVAINVKPIAINQDMKAIKLDDGINSRYILFCLILLKRKILSLITSAGHGTRKFDTREMQKVLVPLPPIEMQNDFVKIVEKVESLKDQYRQNLTYLENLYGALSQKAFKGELDLNQIPLPEIELPKETINAPEVAEPIERLADKTSIPYLISTDKEDQKLLCYLFNHYLQSYKGETFTFDDFWHLADYRKENDEPLGLADYELTKQWLYTLIKNGSINQVFDNEKNKLMLKLNG